jgi:hypothetical protein
MSYSWRLTMKHIILISIYLIFYSSIYGLVGFGVSNTGTLDTVNPSVSIIAPNGGEEWYFGDTDNILWTASDTNLVLNSIYLWYSLDGGNDYISLAEAIFNNGNFVWQIPSIQSFNAIVRVKVNDSFGNYTQVISAAPFSITNPPPAPPEGVTIDVSNNWDAVITWEPVTHDVHNQPITPDGYIVLYNETPNQDTEYYYFLTVTTGLSFVHQGVVHFRDLRFYRVIAYKDYDGRMTDILNTFKSEKNPNTMLIDLLKAERENTGGVK